MAVPADGREGGARRGEGGTRTGPFANGAVLASTTLPHLGVMGAVVPLQVDQTSKACGRPVRGPPHVAAGTFIVFVARTRATGRTVAVSRAREPVRAPHYKRRAVGVIVEGDGVAAPGRQQCYRRGGEHCARGRH